MDGTSATHYRKATVSRRSLLKMGTAGLAGSALLGTANCGGAGQGGGRQVTLDLSYHVPKEHWQGLTMERFADTVNKRSGGEIEIQTYPAAQLYSETDLVEALPNGSVDMGLANMAGWSGTVPAAQIFDVPFLFTNPDDVYEAVQGKPGRLLKGALADHNVTPVMWVPYEFLDITNKVRAIKTPSDIQGMKVRAATALASEMLKQLGASSVTMSGSEAVPALDRGVIDGAITGTTSMRDRAYYDVTDYVTVAPMIYNIFPLFFNLDAWNSLASAHKHLITQVGKEIQGWARKQATKEVNNSIATLKKEGMTIYKVPDSDLAAWRRETEPVRNAYLRNTGQLGKNLLDAVA